MSGSFSKTMVFSKNETIVFKKKTIKIETKNDSIIDLFVKTINNPKCNFMHCN